MDNSALMAAGIGVCGNDILTRGGMMSAAVAVPVVWSVFLSKWSLAESIVDHLELGSCWAFDTGRLATL
jgi:hypothetical protein